MIDNVYMKTNILLIFLFLFTTSLWAGLDDKACVSMVNLQGDVIECKIDLTSFDSSMAEHLENATKLHYYLMKKSKSYNDAYKKLIVVGQDKAALALDKNGDVKAVRVSVGFNKDGGKFQGNGSSGGMIGKYGEKFQGNGSSGGMIGKDVVKFLQGNGSSGGMIGKEIVKFQDSRIFTAVMIENAHVEISSASIGDINSFLDIAVVPLVEN